MAGLRVRIGVRGLLDPRRLAAVAVALVGVALPGAAHATWPGKAKHVFYCDGDLQRVRPDGSHHRTLAVNVGGCPLAVTRRGDAVAYGSKRGLTRMRADGTHKRVILPLRRLSDWIDSVAWSPSGKRIAFTGVREEDVGGYDEFEEVHRVYVVRRDGSGLHLVGRGANPVWSPHGHHLFYVSQHGIARSRPDGSGRHVVVADGGGEIDLSPNGRRIVFQGTGYDPTRGETLTVETFDLRTHRRTSYGANYRTKRNAVELAWAPGGRRISFTGVGDDLRSIRPDGTHLKTLFDFPYAHDLDIVKFAWQTR
jgi:hypothetical protein